MKYLKYYIVLIILISPHFLSAQDIFEIKWTTGYTKYRCALVLFDDGSGKMRVKYYSNGTKMVEQTMVLENTIYGIRLTGYKPVHPGTSLKYYSYSADNFYLSQDEYGNYSLTNIDDSGNTSDAYIRKVTGTYTTKNFLSEFNWKLN